MSWTPEKGTVSDTPNMKGSNKKIDKVEMVNVINEGGDPPIPKDATELTIHQIRACAPLGVRKNITQKMVDVINAAVDDSDVKDRFREHILSWINVMQEGKWKMADYANAVKYVTYKLMGDTQMSAWAKVFPERLQRLVDKGIPDKNISAHVTMYNKTPLVLKITERTLPPLHIINSDILQEAINVEAELMRSANSETVRMKAAATLIEHLKAPESLKVDINVGVSNDTVEDLREITRALAVEQRKMIESGGMSAKGIAEMDVIKKVRDEAIIEAEFDEMEIEPIKRNNLISDFFPGSK